MDVKAAVLAIGTELTSGEVLNTNGAWLGDKLEDLGFSIHSQVVIPDDRTIIHESLTWMSEKVALIIVTGGLGPTSDDFTREILAEWNGQPLEFSESVWQQMNALYLERGLSIRPAHRQQCYFPKDSKIVFNHVGTAHGFSFEAKNKCTFIVLPGPPREIQGMWDSEVVPRLLALAPKKTTDLKVWTCLGATESEVAEVTEEVIKGSGLQIGYRATVPYVKVKLWVPRHDAKSLKVAANLEAALEPWIIARDRDDLAQFLLPKLASYKTISIFDQVSRGQIGVRLSGVLEKSGAWPNSLTVITGRALPTFTTGVPELILSLNATNDPQEFTVGLQTFERQMSETLRLPFKLQVDSKRGALYLTEFAFKWWLAQI